MGYEEPATIAVWLRRLNTSYWRCRTMRMDLPTPVLHSLFALNQAGYEAYVVGGCVRDNLMGKEPFDWDITTSALPEETLSVFQNYRTIETGIQHGTVTVIIDDTPLEITTYRVDGDYTDGRHPDKVAFTRSLAEDLRRRDFTVNAMAYHPDEGVVDLFGGTEDVSAGIIRAVGDPQTRFTEDSLRILRGLRFSATLGFDIEPATAEAIRTLSPTLSRVSAERIATELTKLLCGQDAGRILLEFSDVFERIVPYPLDYPFIAQDIAKVLPTPLHRYGTLFFTLKLKEVAATAENLRFSRRLTEDLLSIIKLKAAPLSEDVPVILRLLNKLGLERLQALLAIRAIYDNADYTTIGTLANTLVNQGACYRISDLTVTGADLLAIGMKPGPNLGNTLSSLLDAVMDGVCSNEKEALLNYINTKSLC